jgi:restriction endonuclease S subunit
MVNPYFLVAFLNSKFGVNQMIRFSSGGLQGHVNLTILEELEVPKLNDYFQSKVEYIIKTSYGNKTNSRNLYNKAEQILLQEIGLQDFEPSKEPVNIKNFSESFVLSGRLDAEYYQVKFEDVIEKIKSQKYDTLNSVVNISKSIEPGSNYYSDDETGLPFMRVADYNKFGLSTPNKRLKLDFVKDNKDKIADLKPKKGTILFSKDGSVGVAYHLRKDFEGVNSGAILHLTVKDESEVIPEYLTLALNSKVVQMQAERDAGGSIILHWRVGEIENVIVPIIDFKKQQQIAELVEQSFKLKNQSEKLLEVAKRAVEIAIEENEAIALDFIAKNAVL